MGHLARDTHLPKEPLKSLGVTFQIWWKKLERDRLTDLEVVGAIDFSHPAAPRERDDSISIPEEGSGEEASVPVRGGRRHGFGGS
jgi:hypothetical protein